MVGLGVIKGGVVGGLVGFALLGNTTHVPEENCISSMAMSPVYPLPLIPDEIKKCKTHLPGYQKSVLTLIPSNQMV